MLVQFCFLLASVFLGIVLAAPPMPEVVGTFPLTQALWNDLHDRSRFPLAWISDEFQGQPTETWREFLRVNGADTIQKEFDSNDYENRGALARVVKKLKGFTATPEAQREMFLSHSGAKQIASKVITDYAKHLKEEQQRTMPHMAAVNEYMALPDTAEDLLYY